jgi:hypothetical protein
MPPHDANSFDLPHPVLTKIGDANTEPTFATILVTHIELNATTSSVYSARGDMLLGHRALTINAIDYKSRSKGNVAFVPPVNPPSVPAHKEGATEVDITEDNRQHKALHLEFMIWHNVDAVLRNLLITAVPGIVITTKKNPVTGFGNVTCLELLSHLHISYGKITEQELEDNITRMRSQWNPHHHRITLRPNLGSPSRSKETTSPPIPPFSAGPTTSYPKQADTTSLAENGASSTLPRRPRNGPHSNSISRPPTGTREATKQLAPQAATEPTQPPATPPFSLPPKPLSRPASSSSPNPCPTPPPPVDRTTQQPPPPPFGYLPSQHRILVPKPTAGHMGTRQTCNTRAPCASIQMKDINSLQP